MATIFMNLVRKSASGKNFHKSRFLNSENEKITCFKKKNQPVIRIVSTTSRVMRPEEEGED